MRVTQSMIYDSSVSYTNSALGRLIHLSNQNATQKKINTLSDDPGGVEVVLDSRSFLRNLELYDDNCGLASDWLKLADDILGQASSLLNNTIALAEQAASGTLTDTQRDMIAEEAREDFEQMVTFANTEFNGDNIFGGHVTDGQTYTPGLHATVRDTGTDPEAVDYVSGSAGTTMIVQFLDAGTVGMGAASDLAYRYSPDGGMTWETGVLAAGDTELDLGTCRMGLADGTAVTAVPSPDPAEFDREASTTIYVRPAATYNGDDSDGNEIRHYGDAPVSAEAKGDFASNVIVRIDSDGDITTGLDYSYSTDDGATWVTGRTSDDGVLQVPGGHLELTGAGGTAVSAGEQFVITPRTADISLDIAPGGGEVVINSVGKDIFGGLYTAPGETEACADPAGADNVLETMANLVAALETNDQDMIGRCLEDLNAAHDHLVNQAGVVGARAARVEFVQSALGSQKTATEYRISQTEDVDLTALTTEISKAQYTYQAVLQTSSIVMGMSLLDYL